MEPNTTIKIALIDNGKLEFIEIANTLDMFQSYVGGHLETWILRQSAHLYFNEDGLRLGYQPNELANYILPKMASLNQNVGGLTQLAPPLPALVGPVMVVGSQEPDGQPDGEEHSISRKVALDLIFAWMGRPLIQHRKDWK